MKLIQDKCAAEGHTVYSFYGRGTNPEPTSDKEYYGRISSSAALAFHLFITRLFDLNGHGSSHATKKFIKELEKIKPDIIHIHNLHGYYINIKILFDYLKKSGVPIVWTLHDCWSFTGRCAFFSDAKCEKWRTGCHDCQEKCHYPKSLSDRSKKEYVIKKNLFGDMPNLTLTTPSKWLADLAKQSYMGKYTTEVVNNGINTKLFAPDKQKTDELRAKMKIKKDMPVILGVASVWDERKRPEDFVSLAKEYENKATFIMVGHVKCKINDLPKNLIRIERTENEQDLATLYAMSDVFVSTSVEETFSLVTAEAMSCGTPIVTVDWGGCSELIQENVGIVVNSTDVNEMRNAIDKVLGDKDSYRQNCRTRAVRLFDRTLMTERYVSLYKKILEGNKQ